MHKPLLSSFAMVCLVASPVSITTLAHADEYPRTASGKPDFSGRYDIATLTPYERPQEYGERQTMSVAQARELEQAALGRVVAGDARSDPDRGPPQKGASVGSYNYAWFDPGSTLFKIDAHYRTSILTDPSNGRLPELSDAGVTRRATLRPLAHKNTGTAWWMDEGGDPYDNPEGLSMLLRCMYVDVVTVPIRPVVYNNLKTIIQTDTHLVIHVEWMHWTRIVRMNAPHAPSDMRSLSGDSIGWWEGDTLVVETTNFLARPGVPRDDLRVVERFNPATAGSLLYQFTVYDPDYETSYSGEFPWPRTKAANFEYACHEGNYAMVNTLRGARQLEQEWREQHAMNPGQ
ncbi:MAG: hypothetical protein QF921_04290 [Pseudomonadales bacterium]|jgi:hypothetical protein|nr:hypothetical protein [Pseudomonadales bacterium]MDP6471064.1 hypothetical protein [Pseudomonadales bacterium]MDP6825750.1 hypothetical protein [Pseudomonadales bacterium]MDP6970721.1 hypothetical protein [Pseudomonadales bacterium]|tara:strand:+ start:1470 stop:2507 length:1038 start_codon:yes stop_codon:yes gene_type:complete